MEAIVAEKASQAKAIAAPFPHKVQRDQIDIAPCSTFPSGAVIVWCAGHLVALKEPNELDSTYKRWSLNTLPILPDTFRHKLVPGKTKRFQAVKSVLKRKDVTSIIAAGDPGREGELIVQLVVQMCGVRKPMKRLWAQSLTKEAIKEAFARLLPIEKTRPLYEEALARSYADWLVGMNTSRAYTLLLQQKHGGREVFATGRVQTPTLALIVKREIVIEEFQVETFYQAVATFDIEGRTYEGVYTTEEGTRLSKEAAEQVAKTVKAKEAEVTLVKEEDRRQLPPFFYTLSSLQAMANKRFKYGAKKTLELLQKLYEKKYITYPRTDSPFVTKAEAAQFPDILAKLASLEAYQAHVPTEPPTLVGNKRYVNPGKVSDHHAILPTKKVPSRQGLRGDEANIYDLVAKSLIAAHLEPAILIHKLVQTVSEGHRFDSKSKQLKSAGWRKVIYGEEKKVEASIPDLSKGMRGTVADVTIKEGSTEPPKRYTEGELITAMKNAGRGEEDSEIADVLKAVSGIGEESTRASIIERLKALRYIELEKHRVAPTAKARVLIGALGDSVLASPELTARWEMRLKEIGQGSASGAVFLQQSKKLAAKLVVDATEASASWKADASYVPSSTTTGGGKSAPQKAKRPVGICPLCGGEVVHKGKLYGCSSYKENGCSFTLPAMILKKKLTEANAKKLLASGKTNTIRGFKGKSTFNARLVWKDETKKQLAFEFENKREGRRK
ncbi:type IA DNA topoisomerase [Shouchella shacheensis]|uniref:type IA DNA topoisomerase n=1 Tax=Shouchella shacheensis TaxID=1649580 RepID=UPI00073FBC19|nr:type IA DNA topoisomerase [Shouchella shacheensis]